MFFEMTETFTLENMFAMELHSHADVLNEIVTAAVKEIAIEKVPFPVVTARRGRWYSERAVCSGTCCV